MESESDESDERSRFLAIFFLFGFVEGTNFDSLFCRHFCTLVMHSLILISLMLSLISFPLLFLSKSFFQKLYLLALFDSFQICYS
jgi:hypothetical protein